MRSSKEIIELIIKLSQERDLSFAELARRTHIAKSSMSRYKNGLRDFPINKINSFAKVLDVTPEYILGIYKNESRLIFDKMYEELNSNRKQRAKNYLQALLDEQRTENRYKNK